MLTLEGLTKIYPAAKNEVAGGIRDANIDVKPGTFFTLLGPSGCGKTTTLRCIAGLEQPDQGKITVDGRTLFDGAGGISVPMHERNIGMVFQSYAIWPHMNVFENVSFPLRVSKTNRYSRSEIEDAVRIALRSVGLEEYRGRSATQLSGGQQQRVALARAIVHRPKLLLLDEPLSNLDAALREDMRTELKRLQIELGITAVYVTHDQSEALALSDLIAVISQGRIVQQGTPWDIYFRPANEFVAGFIGHTNILYGKLRSPASAPGLLAVDLEGGQTIRCQVEKDAVNGLEVAVSIRPENIILQQSPAKNSSDEFNLLTGRVNAASFLGNVVHYQIQFGDRMLQVEGNPDSTFEPGSEVTLAFRPKHTVAVPIA